MGNGNKYLANTVDAAAIADIQGVKALYCRASDSPASQVAFACEMLEAVLHDQFTADYGAVDFASKHDFIRFIIEQVAPQAEWVWHAISSPLVVVDGEEATGHWNVLVKIRRKGEATPIELVGRYTDRFRKVDDAWKIVRIEFAPVE